MKLLSLFVGLLLLGSAFEDTVTIPAQVIGEGVNLRTGPSRNSDILGQLPQGLVVRMLLTDGEWSAIVPPPGTGGWVFRSYLKDGVVVGDRVNLRAGPSVAYASLIKLEEGEKVAVIEEGGEWTKIELPETLRLWVNARYLSTGSESPLASPPRDAVEEEIVWKSDPPSVEIPPPPATPGSVVPLSPPEVQSPSAARLTPGPRSYTGIIRKLEQSFTLDGREYGYELAADRNDAIPSAFLTGQTVDLADYRFRPVRIWAETIEIRPGQPALLEVKGVGIRW